MKIRNTYSLILIGLQIRLLRNISSSENVGFVLDNFNTLKRILEESELMVSLSAVQNINVLRDTLEELTKIERTQKIESKYSRIITEEMKTVEDIVFAESTTKKIYTIPERRYNEKYLLDEPHKLLKSEVFNKFSEIARSDFIAACRCLSFGEGTACAFHILRATEDTLKMMYYHFKKTNRLKKPMWADMTIELKSKRGGKPENIILDNLDVIRKSYRNPTQHPEVVYDIDSAQDLFGLCLDSLNKMTEYL